MTAGLSFSDLGVGGEDFIAKQVVEGRRKLGKKAPDRAKLAHAITAIDYQDTYEGSSTLTITCGDPESQYTMELADFFDIDDDGHIDPIDLQWPEATDNWWRLTQMDLEDYGGGTTLQLTFMERVAVLLMRHHGPSKAVRGKVTRAEFIEQKSEDVKEYGGIRFHSYELHKKQSVAKPDVPKKDRSRSAKGGGFHGNEKLSIHGAPASKEQLRNVDEAFAAVEDLNPPDNAMLGLGCAGIGESQFKKTLTSSLGAKGVFQLMPSWWSRIDWRDTAKQARYWMQHGYWGKGGGIALAKQGKSPGEIATLVEGSGAAPNFYGQWAGEAKALINAWGGGFGGLSVTYLKKYHFTIGTEQNPHENYWDAFNRLASDVRWRLFLDGRDLYYDNDMELIRQRPIAVIDRGDPAVVRFRATWDSRNIATECTLELICDPMEFRAGEVFLLQDFGMASRGSTARPHKRPGYWLVANVSWNNSSFVTTFTLRQPQTPKKEPAPQVGQRQLQSGQASSDAVGVANSKLTYPLPTHGHDLGGVAAHKARAWGNWQSDNAVDIGVPQGTDVFAVDDGTIVKLGGGWYGPDANPNGYNVTLKTKTNEWFYTHMRSRANLKVGGHVTAGQYLGKSGAANGVEHLHIASEHGDPEAMLKVK